MKFIFRIERGRLQGNINLVFHTGDNVKSAPSAYGNHLLDLIKPLFVSFNPDILLGICAKIEPGRQEFDIEQIKAVILGSQRVKFSLDQDCDVLISLKLNRSELVLTYDGVILELSYKNIKNGVRFMSLDSCYGMPAKSASTIPDSFQCFTTLIIC